MCSNLPPSHISYAYVTLEPVALVDYFANAKPTAFDIIPNSTEHRPKEHQSLRLRKKKKKASRGRPRESDLLKSEEKETLSEEQSSLGL